MDYGYTYERGDRRISGIDSVLILDYGAAQAQMGQSQDIYGCCHAVSVVVGILFADNYTKRQYGKGFGRT